MTPELEDRVCLTATLADSYQAAAQLAAKWGSPGEVSTIRAHASQVGQRAATQAQERLRVPAALVPVPASGAMIGDEARPRHRASGSRGTKSKAR